MTDWPMKMIAAEIASGKATVRSLGVLYMVAMGSRSRKEGDAFRYFSDINTAIMDHRCPDGDAAKRAMSLEPIKKVGWELYEAIAKGDNE